MTYINKHTLEVYDRDIDIRYNKEECFEVDELIAPAIIELNKKGYITKFCCSGHIYSCQFRSYSSNHNIIPASDYEDKNDFCIIVFEDNINIPYCPNNFYPSEDYTSQHSRLAIRRSYTSECGTIERLKEIVGTMTELYEWSVSLSTK